jgi:SNF2 family DNA or RNA helicase
MSIICSFDYNILLSVKLKYSFDKEIKKTQNLICISSVIWGPHLIVVPTSVMLNWELELKKWCPAFKILTYYGTQKERKMKRQVT